MSDQLLSIESAAALLRTAQAERKPVQPIKDRLQQADMDVAYAIQEQNTQHALSQGRRLVGRKIGLTSSAVQAQLGVDQPDFGMLFADMAVGENVPILLSGLIQPKVEAEIALVIGKDLTHERHTYADIISATEYALASIEIVDSRIADWKISITDTVADNASSALFVLGSQPVLLKDFSLTECAMSMKHNGVQVSSGKGAACLGNPLNAAVWLANVMVQCGRPLTAGSIILTGALGPMVAVSAAGSYDVTIDGLGTVKAVFE
ncbi:MAG: fumarylacetoacetate hydrolase family protein [Advenella sp.]